MSAISDPDRLQKLIPHVAALGMRVEAREGRVLTLRQPQRRELVGDPDRDLVHGGVITCLLDTVGGTCVQLAGVQVQATLDLRIDYLRPANPGEDLLGVAECYRTTRHVAFVRGTCHQGDPGRPVANMTAAFMLADRPEGVAGGPR